MDRVHRLRHAFTLHELLMSLAVVGVVVGLSVNAARRQLRFYGTVGEAAAVGGQLGHAAGIAASLLWGVSASGGDIVAAYDSSLELRLPIGSAVVCEGAPGRVTIPAPTDSRGNVLGAYMESPQPDDEMVALLDDSVSATWLGMRVAASPELGGNCPVFPSVSATWILTVREQLPLATGSVVRFARPFRLSLYRGSDGLTYLGAQDWNGTAQRFNGIQPVAGPLKAYSPDPTRTGLHFEYRDAFGSPLPLPIESTRIASVRIVARGYSDSAVAAVGLRNE